MWILQYISENIIHLLLLLSVVGLLILPLLHAIPFFVTYKTAAQYILTAVFAFCVFTEGAMSNNSIWEAKVAKQEVKDAETETKMVETQVKYVDRVVVKEKIIKEKADALIIKVPVYITEKNDAECVVPNSFVQLHDYSAKNRHPGDTSDVQAGNSDVTLSEMSETNIKNHELYYQLKNRYEELLNYTEEIKRINNGNE